MAALTYESVERLIRPAVRLVGCSIFEALYGLRSVTICRPLQSVCRRILAVAVPTIKTNPTPYTNSGPQPSDFFLTRAYLIVVSERNSVLK